MANLYKDLAVIYDAVYQSFINYEEEYDYYKKIIDRYGKKNVLEIGSGTGHLAKRFVKNKFPYQGLDQSLEMIAIAEARVKRGLFLQGDMQSFSLKKRVESILITGRTISYLQTNKDVLDTFKRIHHNLENEGILAFDFIDATRFIPMIQNGKKVRHEASVQKEQYIRDTFWSLNLEHGMSFNWASEYFRKDQDQTVSIGKDQSTIRSFTLNEIELFLEVTNFRIREIRDRAAYAFPTYVMVVEKVA